MRERNVYPQIGFTIKQVAAMLGLSQESVRRQVREGNLRAGRLGTRYVVPRSEIDRIVGATETAQ